MKFRKKPVVIEAIQWKGDNFQEIMTFTGDCGQIGHDFLEDAVIIPTLEGNMNASKGDWIIKGLMGEFYPCKPAIFDATYEDLNGH